jgi:hypothetical protein
MSRYTKFDSEIYSEDLLPVAEQEHDEVMQMIAAESEGFAGYGEWSAEIDRSPQSKTSSSSTARCSTNQNRAAWAASEVSSYDL